MSYRLHIDGTLRDSIDGTVDLDAFEIDYFPTDSSVAVEFIPQMTAEELRDYNVTGLLPYRLIA